MRLFANRLFGLPFAIALIVAACSRTPPTVLQRAQEPISFPLEDFALTERSGAKVSKADLLGKVWVASFIFTRCTGTCPQVTHTLTGLQTDLRDLPDVKLVTFTVDPARDNLKELRLYADRFEADKERWWFLTGEEKEIHRLLRESFKVPVMRNENGKPGDEFDHSTRLAVVDRQGNVRGYFQGMGELGDPAALDAELKKLKDLVIALLAEKS
jgi:cytochrome oxidase Cu insertion factor (SCO1/SenC/PrrC family)